MLYDSVAKLVVNIEGIDIKNIANRSPSTVKIRAGQNRQVKI